MTYLEQLRHLQTNGPDDPFFGICWHMDLSFTEEDRLQEAVVAWPEGTGCVDYPIPAPGFNPEDRGTRQARLDARRYYRYAPNLWVGRQGELRQKLLTYLIETEERYYVE